MRPGQVGLRELQLLAIRGRTRRPLHAVPRISGAPFVNWERAAAPLFLPTGHSHTPTSRTQDVTVQETAGHSESAPMVRPAVTPK